MLENLNADIKSAMKEKNKAKLRALRAIKAEIVLLQTDGSNRTIDEATEIALLQRMIKQRKQSMEIFEAEGREDLALREREEIEYIQPYLPKQMSEEEMNEMIQEGIKATGAQGMKDMGKLMGYLQPKVAGRVDGKTLAQGVKAALS